MNTFFLETNLITLTPGSTGFTSIRSQRGMRNKIAVQRTLRALAGVLIYVMSRWAWYTGNAGHLGAKRTSLTCRGYAIHGISY